MSRSSLLRKYNVPGPRYTSYPTVPYWDRTPTVDEWISTISTGLDESKATGVGAAIYVHIPFCQSLCTYCGCNTRITRNRTVGNPYVDTVLKEFKLYMERLGRTSISVGELHLGGGTPTFLTAGELSTLMEGLSKYFTIVPNSEFSVEVDPRVTTRDQLEALQSFGFKRISLGVQDFDPKVQDIVNRIQSAEQVRKVTEDARSLGYTSVNYDLIYGLPFQNLQSVMNTMDVVKGLRPDRIAFYGYAHVPWIKPGQRRFTEDDLPAGDDKRKLYEKGREILEDAGYREIGMDHFALETDSLWSSSQTGQLHRNFMGYTARLVAPLFGLGVSAIGDSWRSFMQNEKLLETYQDRVNKGEIPILRGHYLSDEDLVLRRHVLNLMTRFKTDWKDSAKNTEFLGDIRIRLKELESDDLVKLSPTSCEVTEEGRAFVRNICMAFDARLARKAPDTQLFSKTV